jgi:mRNA interferase MazF
LAILVPLTTRNRGLNHHVRIDSPESGVKQPSWARTEDIKAVSTQRFARPAPLGTASISEVAELREMIAFP